jgi:hypothetical protein
MLSSPCLRDSGAGAEGATRCTEAADLSVSQLTAIVTSPSARCWGTSNPDDWFPVAARRDRARIEGARALQVCAACPVRAQCLELSMRVWHAGGRHGIWGGLIAADRAEAHRRWLAGATVGVLLSGSG